MIRLPILVREASKAEKVISQLGVWSGSRRHQKMACILEEKHKVLLKQIDFQYSDGSEGSAFIVTNVGSLIPK